MSNVINELNKELRKIEVEIKKLLRQEDALEKSRLVLQLERDMILENIRQAEKPSDTAPIEDLIRYYMDYNKSNHEDAKEFFDNKGMYNCGLCPRHKDGTALRSITLLIASKNFNVDFFDQLCGALQGKTCSFRVFGLEDPTFDTGEGYECISEDYSINMLSGGGNTQFELVRNDDVLFTRPTAKGMMNAIMSLRQKWQTDTKPEEDFEKKWGL